MTRYYFCSMPITKCNNIPRVIHYIYLNRLSSDYLGGDKYSHGLLEVLKKSQKEKYQVCFWAYDFSGLEKSMQQYAPTANALLDAGMSIIPPGIRLRNLKEIEDWIKRHCTVEFARDMLSFIEQECYGEHNLAAASNIFRYFILYIEGGLYFDLSKGMIKPEYSYVWEESGIQMAVSGSVLIEFDTMLKNTSLGFTTLNEGNFQIISSQYHSVLEATILDCIKNYRLMMKIELKNIHQLLSHELVVDHNGFNYNEKIGTIFPVQYRRFVNRNRGTELTSGVYPLMVGIFKHYYNLSPAVFFYPEESQQVHHWCFSKKYRARRVDVRKQYSYKLNQTCMNGPKMSNTIDWRESKKTTVSYPDIDSSNRLSSIKHGVFFRKDQKISDTLGNGELCSYPVFR